MSEVSVHLSNSILQAVRASVSAETFQTWFRDVSVQEVDGDVVRMEAPNRYVKQWLEAHYIKELLRATATVIPQVARIELIALNGNGARAASDPAVSLGKALNNTLPSQFQAGLRNGNGVPHAARETVRLLPLSPKMRLESFLAGKSNRIAHAAAQSISESPAAVYNPFFIHGGHGLGKTHLLQGIGHLLSERTPPLAVVYLTSEEFTNAYVCAVQTKRLDAFRARFRNCDALLIDDVQFFGGREKTQEEFLHTFDVLRHAGKQIVLCSNVAPRAIERLDAKLAARFQSGLVARLEAPDPALRCEVLRENARGRSLALPQDVVDLLATHVENNIRELEGVVCKLLALARAEKKDPDRELALHALRELGYLRSGPVSLQDILSAVSARYHFSEDDLRSGKRHQALVHARHIGIFLSKLLTGHLVGEIGRFYGNRDHATVLHAAKKIAALLRRDEELLAEVQSLKQFLGR